MRQILSCIALLAAFIAPAMAAGGGGSAGGSGAQNAIASGRTMADGQLGPLGSPNNPRPTPEPPKPAPAHATPETPR